MTRSRKILEFYLNEVVSPTALDPSSLDSLICDAAGDRGLDAYVIDPDTQHITLVQCKWFDEDGKKIPEKDSLELLNFYKLRYLGGNRTGLNDDVRAFLARSKAQFSGWPVKLCYLTNGTLDPTAIAAYEAQSLQNGNAFSLVSRRDLCDGYIRALSQEEPIDNQVLLALETGAFFATSFPGIKDLRGKTIDVLQCVARAVDLRRAYGRGSNKLFIRNLRYGLAGKINEAMKETAESDDRHAFYIFHNGISVVCEDMRLIHLGDAPSQQALAAQAPEIDEEEEEYALDLASSGVRDAVWLRNFQIVNGAQSTITLSDVPDEKLKDIKIPCKVTRAPSPEVSALIARYNNTQNKITPVDLVANSAEQTLLQNYAATRFDPQIFYQRKRGEKWIDLFRASGKAPPRERRLDFVKTYQAFLSFCGWPGGAYTRPAALIYPDTPGYDQISDFPDKELILMAGLIANHERNWEPPAKKPPREYEKFWTQWAVGVFGHAFRIHLEEPDQTKLRAGLLGPDGQKVWKRVREGLVEIFDELFDDYFDQVEDHQDFFKNDEEAFNLRGFSKVKVSDVSKYVIPRLRGKGDLYTMKQEQAKEATKIDYYEVNFAVVAAIVDKIVQDDKSIIVKIRGS